MLRSSTRARVYEARRDRDGELVIAKVFDVADPAIEARAEHEFQLIHRLEIAGVVRALALERAGSQLVLLLERVPGVNLDEYAAGEPLALDDSVGAGARLGFLHIAIALARTLAQVHERGILHRDIKPSNILVDGESRQVFLADFGLSMLVASDTRYFSDPDVVEGTLPYISPEQTGRIKRAVDFRSDLYSLGATFYELLTGRRPFVATTPLELIHAHLARRARPVHELRPELPSLLSAMVMRLLEKLPERRYQSAAGLQADLERLAAGLAKGEADPKFVLGERDHPAVLQMPHRLYGRASELEAIEAMLAGAIARRQTRVVLIVGDAGIGKSALIGALEEPLARRGGQLASGGFSTGQRDQPYRALVEALTRICDQLLIESDERLADWREQLRARLGPLARVLLELTPSAEALLGELDELPVLELAESKNRLHLAVGRFLSVIADRQPLVLAFDDVHEADASSLELLRSLVFKGIEGSALIVLTIRRDALVDDPAEPDAHAALRSLVAGLESLGERVARIEPGPLARADLSAWLADVLGRAPDELVELAELIARKTESNPLFVHQFIRHLADTKLLRAEQSGWRWDAQAIATAGIPSDLLAMLSAKLERLPADQRRMLALAACIGFEFEVRTLEAIAGLAPLELAAILHQLELAGLISAGGRRMQFTHERLVEPAAHQLDELERARQHWAIGCFLLRVSASGESLRGAIKSIHESGQSEVPPNRISDDELFAIVEHLAAGFEQAGEFGGEPRLNVASLALEAGKRALRAASWPVAHRLLGFAVALIEPWSADARRGRGEVELAFAIHFAHAQARALANPRVEAEVGFDELLDWQLSVVARGQVVARRVRILALNDRLEEAVRAGLAGLARLGFSLSLPAGKLAMLSWSWRAWRAYRKVDLTTLRVATDPTAIAALDIANAIKTPAYVVDIKLFVVLTGMVAELTLRHGRHPTTPVALAQFGIAVQAGFGKPDVAARICDQALAMVAERPNDPSLPRAESAALLVWPATRPVRSLLTRVVDVQRRASEAGDLEVAGFQAALGLGYHVYAGVHLRELLRLGERWTIEVERFGSAEMQQLLAAYVALIRMATAAEGAPKPKLVTREQVVEAGVTQVTVYAVVSVLIYARLLRGEWAEALHECESVAADYELVARGSTQPARFAILYALALGQRWPRAGKHERRGIRARLREQMKLSRSWVKWCPDNFASGAALVEAELAAVEGDDARAQRRFEDARRLADEYGQYDLLGLYCEAFARFAQRRGRVATAQEAIRQAIDAHRQWGATALVRELERRHALWLSDPRGASDRHTLTVTRRVIPPPSADTSVFALDVASVLSTLQAISEELGLDEVVMRVLEGALENAGAERGSLLLEREGVVGLVAASDGVRIESFAQPISLREAGDRVPLSVLNFVLRTGKSIVLDDAQQDSRFASDPYVSGNGVRSLLCVAIVKQNRRVGALVLENRLSTHGFDAPRLEILRILVGQAASALDNARLYDALQRSEAQWRSLVEGVPDIIALLDERGKIEFINHVAPYRVQIEAAIGESAEHFIDPEGVVAWRQAFADVLATGELRQLEVRWTASDASEPSVYVIRLAPITFGGRVGKILSISTDVSERRRNEAQRARLETQLRQQQRLESIGTLASGVAHEINNPVQGIMNYAELIAERSGDPALVEEFALEIGDESQRVATIVRNLLAFSRQERESPYEISDVATLIEDTLSLIRTVIRRDQIQLDVVVPEGLPPLRCRTQQIQQIIMNLVTNARDALNERWEEFAEQKRIELRAAAIERDGHAWVRISVEDRGGGIPAALHERIFEPFFTTKGGDRGTGLGLAVSRGIALEHGGELRVVSEVGVGSSFQLELPVSGARGG
ncbi:protein kinase domain-containing protein [Nannocystaceae bacterium ST9]